MPVRFDEEKQIFFLENDEMSYIIGILKGEYLVHYEWGKRVTTFLPEAKLTFLSRPNTPTPEHPDRTFLLDTLPQEYPTFGRGDFRSPAIHLIKEDGTSKIRLRYKGYEIRDGKEKLPGLPSTFAERKEEATTLRILLADDAARVHVNLYYTIFHSFNVVARSVQVQNDGNERLKLDRIMSASLDFADDQYDLLYLAGAPLRERWVKRQPLSMGLFGIGSIRGASSHQFNPFYALVRKGGQEEFGDVYSFSLIYSGNFLGQVEVDHYSTTRASIGIHPFQFAWELGPGDSFQTPEAILAYSGEGLGAHSRMMHRFIRRHIMKSDPSKNAPPVLINTWEAVYFSMTEEKLERLAEEAAQVGIELLVIDDGWFGKRKDDTSSLGDWDENRALFPNGLAHFAKRITDRNLRFGLWIEPEMISPDSDLYRHHPDWVLQVPNDPPVLSRNQWVLDLSREDVVLFLIEKIDKILSTVPISYLKWDMNRPMTDVGSRMWPAGKQQEVAHRYILGLYRILEEIKKRHPAVLIEGCAGGGGRYDLGMLHYMPQIWTSDNSDAASRILIQYGTSLLYPVVTMGAHVSDVPNHQVGRTTPLSFRGHVAMSGNLGYELDLTKLKPAERAEIKKQIDQYKEIRPLIQEGDYYRLLDPFAEERVAAWMFVDEGRRSAVLFYFQIFAHPNPPLRRIRLKGLDPAGAYRCKSEGWEMSGNELMHSGFQIPVLQGDFQSIMYRFEKIDN